MKLRRALLAFIVLAGFLVLVLGVTGVLSPKRPEPVVSKTGNEGGRREDTIDDFEIKGDAWLLKADQARPKEGGGYELIKPSLELKQTVAAGEERLSVQASEGTLQMEPEKHVRMSGGVHMEFVGVEKITMTTPSVEVAPDEATGRTADEVEMVVDAKEGRQHIWGKGAEFISKQRLSVVSENIRMELSGAGSDIFPQAATAGKAAPAEAPVTKIECRGPATADGFKRTADLKGDVHIHQGENTLRADHVEVQFAENSRAPERFVAEGGVTFNAAGADGSCDRLERSALEDQLLLDGRPARVHRGPNEIEATRIELSGQKGVITVPVPGKLRLAAEQAAQPAEPIDVKWSRTLHLDPDEHRALFLGDVRFARGDQTIECQTLSVKLDSQNQRILECKADTDVRMAARMQGAAGQESVNAQAKELTYDPEKNSLILSGGAALQQGQRTIRGERMEIHPADAEIAVAGKGVLEGQAENDSEGFSITWEREMRFSRATQSAVFEGSVGLKYGAETLRAESLTAQLSENALKGFKATGGVYLAEKSGRTLKADSLSADIGADRKPQGLDATGHVAIQEEVPAEHLTRTLTADRVISAMDEKTKLQEYKAIGHAALREDAGSAGVRTMRAEQMTAKVGAENQLEAFDAVGRPVIVEEEGRVARGDRLTWDAQRDSGTLFGSPVELRMGLSRLFGDRLEFAPKRGAITVISNRRVEATVTGGAPGTTNLLP
ncbi:MAG: LptA/OstA family protein [Candidatus Brocadiia bacterium]|jgi:lipopolysaccharide transport protein LptA